MCCVLLCTAFYCQYCIPGLETGSELFLNLRRFADEKEEFALEALVLVPPEKGSRVNQARVAVAELTATSTLCWATTKVTGGNPYEALLVGCVHGPTEAGPASEQMGKLIEDFMKRDKTFLKGSSKQTLPSGKPADTLQVSTKDANCWIMGPSCFQPAPVRLLTAAAECTHVVGFIATSCAHTSLCLHVLCYGTTLQAAVALLTDRQPQALKCQICACRHMTHGTC
jgi:hypothetical protein